MICLNGIEPMCIYTLYKIVLLIRSEYKLIYR